MFRLEPVLLGVIGGTGFYSIKDFQYVAEVNPLTPWGYPSSPITIARSPKGTPVAFLARHGRGHIFSPSEVPSRANIAALKHLGVNAIVAFSAVGSLQDHIRPRDFLVPNQIIDRTRGIRPGTFFEKGLVGHAMFAEPFDVKMEKIVWKAAKSLEGGSKLHTVETSGGKDVTLICMEGPCFSTRAESHLYRSFGGSVINMYPLGRIGLMIGPPFQRQSSLVKLRSRIK
jgi:5'-methylthioadenosine phosphorylase